MKDTTTAVQPAPSLADQFVGRRYLQLILVLGALNTVGPLAIDMYLPALPALRAELNTTDSGAQLTMTGLVVGLGLGQLVIGPLSDAVGRRKPLLVGLAAHGLMSVCCAMAPSIAVLVVARSLQGIGGAAIAVVAMATVRDIFAGVRAAQLLSRMVLILGVAPILAPSLGSALLSLTSWRGIFVLLAIIATGAFALAFFALPETLPVERRQRPGLPSILQTYRALLRDPVLLIMVGVAGLLFGTIFSYASGAPFLMQNRFGLTPQQFGLAFSANALGMIVVSQLNPLLLRRYSPVRMLACGLVIGILGSLALLTNAIMDWGDLLGFLFPMFVVVTAAGLSMPNVPAIALSRHGKTAGTAAALLGAVQFVVGGSIAPVVGAMADGTARPLAAIMVLAMSLAGLALIIGRRSFSSLNLD